MIKTKTKIKVIFGRQESNPILPSDHLGIGQCTIIAINTY